MSGDLLTEVCSPRNIATAWGRFATGHGIWRTGWALREVAAAPVGPLLELVDDLRSGSYRPGRPIAVPIAKGDGSIRTLAVFPVRDRVAQRAVLQVVQRVSEPRFLPSSFGFRPGRGVALALGQARRWIAAGFGWAVDADIRDCFGSLPHDLLLQRVADLLPDDSLMPLIAAMIKSGVRPATASDGRTGIAQGSCLSPWLCNVYLHVLDTDMDSREVPLVRYADDFLAFCLSRSAAERAMERLSGILEQLRLALHPQKSRIGRFSDGIRFLGEVLAKPPMLPQLPARRTPCCSA